MTSSNITLSRVSRLRGWMADLDITYTATAKELQITPQRVRYMLKNDTMPTHWHGKCLALGFPADLLPEPCDKPTGRKTKIPMFPGLTSQQNQSTQAEAQA